MATTTVALHGLTKHGAVTPDMIIQLLSNGLSMGSLFNEFAQINITATGTTQATAFQTVGQTLHVGTAAANSGILLPPAVAGLEVLVINKGANSLQVYGNGIDLIDDVATATGVQQMVNSTVIYTCTASATPGVAGKWYSEGLATGFGQVGLQTLSFRDSITANAGGGQQLSGTSLLNTMISRVTVVATAGDSVTLPVSKAGMSIVVANGTAATSMNIFPNTGETINALGANAAFAAAGLTLTIFYCFTAGAWFTK